MGEHCVDCRLQGSCAVKEVQLNGVHLVPLGKVKSTNSHLSHQQFMQFFFFFNLFIACFVDVDRFVVDKGLTTFWFALGSKT